MSVMVTWVSCYASFLLRKLVADLNRECEPRGVQLTMTPLESEAIEPFNQMLTEGHPLEASVQSLRVGASRCDSCGELSGREESCWTLELGSASFEVPPAYLIRDVICRLGRCC